MNFHDKAKEEVHKGQKGIRNRRLYHHYLFVFIANLFVGQAHSSMYEFDSLLRAHIIVLYVKIYFDFMISENYSH